MSSSRSKLIFYKGQPVSLPPRYTPSEWKTASARTHYVAESDRERAERLLSESIRVADETREISQKAQLDVDWKFKQRLNDIEQWKKELGKKKDDINEETDALSIYLKRVENCLASHQPILSTNNRVLRLREGRQGIDLVNDVPQEQLLKEVNLIKKIQSDLQTTVAFCKEELRILRKCAYTLNNELKDKTAALEIDKLALGLNEHRTVIQSQYTADYW